MKFVFDMIAETRESLANMRDCSKAKKSDMPLFNFIFFFWCSYEPFTIISTIMVFMVVLAISFGVEFYIFLSVSLSLGFIVFSFWSHMSMASTAKKRLDDFEAIITQGTKKNAVGDNKDFKMFVINVDVKKCSAYPVFSTSKSVIKNRKLDFVFVTNDAVKICTGATPFDLLNPTRKPEGCAEVKNGAKCTKDIAIKNISSMAFANGGVEITKPDGSKEVIYNCNDKTAGDVMKAYKDSVKANEEKAKAKAKEDAQKASAKAKEDAEKKANSDIEAVIRVIKLFKTVGDN